MAIWAARYVKAGPNEVLIISGRQRQLPDGRRLGSRCVGGGGTFVLPVVEKVELLSLEVITVEMPKSQARAAKGERLMADCNAQAKIGGDDDSIVTAAEHFLSKRKDEIKEIVRRILEKHLRTIVSRLSVEEVSRDLEGPASKVHAASSIDLAKMGLELISFTIEDISAA